MAKSKPLIVLVLSEAVLVLVIDCDCDYDHNLKGAMPKRGLLGHAR